MDVTRLFVVVLVVCYGITNFQYRCGSPQCDCIYDDDSYVVVDCSREKDMSEPPVLQEDLYAILLKVDMSNTDYCLERSEEPPVPYFCRAIGPQAAGGNGEGESVTSTVVRSGRITRATRSGRISYRRDRPVRPGRTTDSTAVKPTESPGKFIFLLMLLFLPCKHVSIIQVLG